MELSFSGCVRGLLAGALLLPGITLACSPVQNGCLGCNDNELPACLQAFVTDICETSGNLANCDTKRAYDDAERRVIISTGTHMAKVRSMVRSSRKYQAH